MAGIRFGRVVKRGVRTAGVRMSVRESSEMPLSIVKANLPDGIQTWFDIGTGGTGHLGYQGLKLSELLRSRLCVACAYARTHTSISTRTLCSKFSGKI